MHFLFKNTCITYVGMSDFSAICQKLHDLQLIDESYLINDFDFIRNHYQKELNRLVNVAKSVSPVVQRCNIPVSTVAIKK